MPTEFEVNIDAILASSSYIGRIGSRIGTIEGELKNIARLALEEVFEEAMIDADSYEGFPTEWQDHTMRIIRSFKDFYIIYDGASVFVSMDFDALGTQQELRRAFHQGARLEGGGNLWGPYEGQRLAAQDPEAAHTFWEAIRYGKDTAFNPTTGKRMPTRKAKYQWDEVVNKYVEIWGDKCPEWLFIQYGQEEWEPIVPQFDIIGEFESRFYSLCEQMLVTFVDTEIAIANAYESVGSSVGFTSRGQPRLTSGSFVNPKTGKTIRPGQFAPRL